MIKARYRRIVFFFARVILSFAWWDLILPRLGLGVLARRSRDERLRTAAASFRVLAVAMGGVMIKVGQFLSTRVDVLPPAFTDELTGLQDEVPAESFEAIRRVAEAEFGESIEARFLNFDPSPLAAASLGQVHRARMALPPEDDADSQNHTVINVVVKVQRPFIEAIIDTDLAALRTVGSWFQKYPPIRKRVDVPALIREFSRILYEEIDYLAEGRNAETFAANFRKDARVKVPKVIWSHTTRRALTLEDVFGIKITDYAEIERAGVPTPEVAVVLLDVYLQQIFEDGFFHADPHPGNLFIAPRDTNLASGNLNGESSGEPAWKITFVDFGMVGRLPPNTQTGLREMLIGVGTRDAARVVRSYKTLGLLLPGADLDLLEKAEERVFERFWGKNMDELRSINQAEIGQFVDEFREIVYQMPFQIPQDFIFLARTVGILSGICTGLDQNFNVWENLAPYAEKIIAREAPALGKRWIEDGLSLVRALITVPPKLDSLIKKIDRGDLEVRVPEIKREVARLGFAIRWLSTSIVFAAFLISGVEFYLAGIQWPAFIAFGLAATSLLVTIFVHRRA